MHARSVPTDLPTRPTDLPQKSGNGLSVGAAIGIGIGIALIVLLCAVGAWILVRRRRRTWAANKRKQDEESHRTGRGMSHVTPDEEIARRMREWEQDVKLWDGKRGDEVVGRASSESEDEKEHQVDVEKAHELTSPVSPVVVEVRNAQLAVGGKAFAVELEGCSVVEAKTRQETTSEEQKKIHEVGQ